MFGKKLFSNHIKMALDTPISARVIRYYIKPSLFSTETIHTFQKMWYNRYTIYSIINKTPSASNRGILKYLRYTYRTMFE